MNRYKNDKADETRMIRFIDPNRKNILFLAFILVHKSLPESPILPFNKIGNSVFQKQLFQLLLALQTVHLAKCHFPVKYFIAECNC